MTRLYARRAVPDAPLFPLDEPIGAVLFGARRLEQLVNDAARACGLEVVELEPMSRCPRAWWWLGAPTSS